MSRHSSKRARGTPAYSKKLSPTAPLYKIRLSEYGSVDVPGALRPDAAAHSPPAGGRRALRRGSDGDPRRPPAHRVAPPRLPAEGRPGGDPREGALDLLPPGPLARAVPREAAGLPVRHPPEAERRPPPRAAQGVGRLLPPMSRRLVSEALGTALLLAAVVGSGLMGQRLSDAPGLILLANTLA